MVAIHSEESLFSAEFETLTAVPNHPEMLELAVSRFLDIVSNMMPSLPSAQGIMTGYSKIYCDCGAGPHLEFALVEVDDPYVLPSIFERVQIIAARALERLSEQGIDLVLANNNHSELLTSGTGVWGAHENFLVSQHPQTFTEEILPFLVTRIFQGAGGVHYPSGDFLAGVRPLFMELATGGGTTEMRAIHSTAREEHHMGPDPGRFRYHNILGDGHRSHFNLALQFGATDLAIKAILSDSKLRSEIRTLRRRFSEDWVGTLRRLNVLAKPGKPLEIDPLVVETQQVYLSGARRYASSHRNAPPWSQRLLNDWEATLNAFRRLDRTWLARRLDAFAKYELFSAALLEAGTSWARLPGNKQLFSELALLDQSFHEFRPSSVFAKIEAAGLLSHRVAKQILPGEEADPFVPEVGTRARARARFLKENKDHKNFVVDWSRVSDIAEQRQKLITDPFAKDFSEWSSVRPSERVVARSLPRGLRRLPAPADILTLYDQGEYERAHGLLQTLEHHGFLLGQDMASEQLRQWAWVQARRGEPVALDHLRRVYGDLVPAFNAVNDYCSVYRFLDLIPDLPAVQPWIDRGFEHLQSDAETPKADYFRENVAYILVHNGQPSEALDILEPVAAPSPNRHPRIYGRILATLGEIHRVQGNRRQARRRLGEAIQLQLDHNHLGFLADFTYLSAAKAASRPIDALRWIAKAQQLQTRTRNRIGLTVSLLLEARISTDATTAEQNRSQIVEYRSSIPSLRSSTSLAEILTHWDQWTSGEIIARSTDAFWGI